MITVVEYMPGKTKAETDKMIDDLRTLGLQELLIQSMQKPTKGGKNG